MFVKEIIKLFASSKDPYAIPTLIMIEQIFTDPVDQTNRLAELFLPDDTFLSVVPRGLTWHIVKMCHDEVGHPALQNSLKMITIHFWFPRVRNFVKKYLKSCVEYCFC